MKVSYSEGLANHAGPESWRYVRKDVLQALTGEGAGWPLSREISSAGVLTVFLYSEGNTEHIVNARCVRAPRGQRPHARTETLYAEPGISGCWLGPVGHVRAVNPKGVLL
jgi:hypothetical protein